MNQARSFRSVLILSGLLGGAALVAAALAAIGPRLRSGGCRPAAEPEARVVAPEPNEEDAGRMAFV